MESKKMLWVGVPIHGYRPTDEFMVTYSTWEKLPDLPKIKPFEWVPEISRHDCENLSVIELIKKYSKEIDLKIDSPTSCFLNIQDRIILNGKEFQPFYHDQQGCVHWAMYGTDNDHEVVIYDLNWDDNNIEIIATTGHTIDSFLWRMYLESSIWENSYDREKYKNEIKSNIFDKIKENNITSDISCKIKEHGESMKQMYLN